MAHKYKSQIQATSHLYIYRAGDECFYCRDVENLTWDHSIPVSYVAELAPGIDQKLEIPVVIACLSCNCTAGGKVFASAQGKRDYIAQQLRIQYRKLLAMPNWTQRQLDELGDLLRNDILSKIRTKKWLIERLENLNRGNIKNAKTKFAKPDFH